MGIPSLEEYLRFFLDAGIPALASQKYAQAFHANRIRTEMLPHLNKHLLNEMGITILGDIFAILGHASDPKNILLTQYPLQSQNNSVPTQNSNDSRELKLYQVKKAIPSPSSDNLHLNQKSQLNRPGHRSIFNRLDVSKKPHFKNRNFLTQKPSTLSRSKLVGKSHSSFQKDRIDISSSSPKKQSVFSRLDNPRKRPSVFDRLD